MLMIAATHDRFRGTTQRWTVDSGPFAGTSCDYAFNEDWSLTWRTVAGPQQGCVGRAREFLVQPIRAQLFLVTFSPAEGERVTAAIDFASRRFVCFRGTSDRTESMTGSFRVV